MTRSRSPLALLMICGALGAGLAGCGGDEDEPGPAAVGSGAFLLEAWADNWFAAYLGEDLIGEDSVPITTERSFNAERFRFDGSYPLVLNFVLKDFKANDSGLEYIGAPNQQMGDGGFIAQITDTTTGQVIGVSDADWRCLVIHRAPLDKSCEGAADPLTACTWEVQDEPTGWKAPGYDVSGWDPATVHTAAAVGPKQGYEQIDWDDAARLIWGADLESDNTVLCRVVLDAP